MDIKEFYEKMQLTYFENEIYLDLYEKDKKFRKLADEVKKNSESVVDSLNSGKQVEDKDNKQMRDLKASVNNLDNYITNISFELSKSKGDMPTAIFVKSVSKPSNNFEVNWKNLENKPVEDKEDKNAATDLWGDWDKEDSIDESVQVENKVSAANESVQIENKVSAVDALVKNENKAVSIDGSKKINVKDALEDEDDESLDEDEEDEYSFHESDLFDKEEENPQIPSININTVGAFTKFFDKLTAAKTRYNSGAYNNIVNYVKSINTKAEKYDSNVPGYAAKLIKTKELINDYLYHKASGGVKQNSFKKLAAVEVLNKEIDTRLKALSNALYGKNDKLRKTIDETIFDTLRVEVFTNENGETVRNTMGKIEIASRVEKAKKKGISVDDIADMIPADECMHRILSRATSEAKIQSLSEMRQMFRKNPSNKLVDNNKKPAAKQKAHAVERKAHAVEKNDPIMENKVPVVDNPQIGL